MKERLRSVCECGGPRGSLRVETWPPALFFHTAAPLIYLPVFHRKAGKVLECRNWWEKKKKQEGTRSDGNKVFWVRDENCWLRDMERWDGEEKRIFGIRMYFLVFSRPAAHQVQVVLPSDTSPEITGPQAVKNPQLHRSLPKHHGSESAPLFFCQRTRM